MLKLLLNILVPNRCICGEIMLGDEHSLCPVCWENIGFIGNKSVCSCCGIPLEYQMSADSLCPECIMAMPEFSKARCVFKYNDYSGKIISGLKYMDKTPYAKTLAFWMSKKIPEICEGFDIITAVPLHRNKLVLRKYNQSALLSNSLARLTSKKANNLILKKVKNIKPQASLSRKDRIENIKGAYKINSKFKKQIEGKNILLVDDVITTGATANECAKVLKKSGANAVYLLTAARTVLE